MESLRRLCRLHPTFAWALIALALAVRTIVPQGFMPIAEAGGVRITICDGMTPAASAPRTIALPGMAHDAADPAGEHPGAKHDGVCAFAGLGLAALGAGDGPVLAVPPLAPIAVAAATPATLRLADRAHLRPPLRGPPLPA